MTVREAIRTALAGELERDPTTFLMGKYLFIFQFTKYHKTEPNFLEILTTCI